MRESQSHNGNGSNRANVANGSNGSNGPVPGERQWREDIKPFVPNTGESFEVSERAMSSAFGHSVHIPSHKR